MELKFTKKQLKEIKEEFNRPIKVYSGVEVPIFEGFSYSYSDAPGIKGDDEKDPLPAKGDIPKVLNLVQKHFPSAKLFGITHGGYQITLNGGDLEIVIQMADFKVHRLVLSDRIERQTQAMEGKDVTIKTLEKLLKSPMIKERAEYDMIKKATNLALHRKYLKVDEYSIAPYLDNKRIVV